MKKATQKQVDNLQQELHQFVEVLKKNNNNIEYQDIANVFFMVKIAEIQNSNTIKSKFRYRRSNNI